MELLRSSISHLMATIREPSYVAIHHFSFLRTRSISLPARVSDTNQTASCSNFALSSFRLKVALPESLTSCSGEMATSKKTVFCVFLIVCFALGLNEGARMLNQDGADASARVSVRCTSGTCTGVARSSTDVRNNLFCAFIRNVPFRF